MGYQVSSNGVCYGVTHSAIHAILNESWPLWREAFNRLTTLSPMQITMEIESARLRRADWATRRAKASPIMRAIMGVQSFSHAMFSKNNDSLYLYMAAICDSIVVYQYWESDGTSLFSNTSSPNGRNSHAFFLPTVKWPHQDYQVVDTLLEQKKEVQISQLRLDNLETFKELLNQIHKQVQNSAPSASAVVAMEMLFFSHALVVVYDGNRQAFTVVDHDMIKSQPAEETFFDVQSKTQMTIQCGELLWEHIVSSRWCPGSSCIEDDMPAMLAFHLRVFAPSGVTLTIADQGLALGTHATYDTLMTVATWGNSQQLHQVLTSKAWNFEVEVESFNRRHSGQNNSPLTFAILNDDIDSVRSMIDQGMPIDSLSMHAVFQSRPGKPKTIESIREIVIDASFRANTSPPSMGM